MNIFEIYKKFEGLLLTLIVLTVSFFIRSYHLSSESLYGDEPYSIFYAQQSLQELKYIFLHDQNPPMHIALLHYWLKIFGVSVVSAKMLSLVCSVFAGLILAKFSKTFLNPETTVFVFFLFLFSNAQQFYSIEVRPYALIQLLCISSFFVYFRILTNPQKKDILFLFLLNLLLLFTHYLSLFILVTQFVFIWFYFKKNKKGFVYYFISQLLLAVAFLPWISVLLYNLPKAGSFWNHAPNYDDFRWHTNILLGGETLFYVFNTLVIVSLILIFINKYHRVLNEKFNLHYYFIFLTLYILPVVLDFIVSQKTPVFLTRYILYTTFGLFLSLAYVFSCLEIKKSYKYMLISPFVILILASFSPTQEREEEWNKMIPAIKSKQDKNTIILIASSYKYKDFAFYYDFDAFKNYLDCVKILAGENVYVFPENKLLGWEKLDFDNLKKIIYVHSHSFMEDPDHKIEEFIESKGFKESENYNKFNTGYKLYIRNKIEPKPLTIISETPSSPCDIIKNFVGTNTEGDTNLIFKTSLENYESCKLACVVSDKIYSEGKISILVNEQFQYSPGLIKKISEIRDKRNISINANIMNESDSKGVLVVSVEKNGQQIYRNDFIIFQQLKTQNKWVSISWESNLPTDLPEDADLKIYFWNPAKKVLLIENFTILCQKQSN